MLLHIRPRLFSPLAHVALVELEIAPLGVRLVDGVDLATRRPVPNKRYAVACRKQGRKAIDGILIETEKAVDQLDITARWAIAAELVVTHRVRYTLLDHDFDAASDHMFLWHATLPPPSGKGWPNRLPFDWEDRPDEPVMEVTPEIITKAATQREDIIDGKTGFIIVRRETFAMPTIEKERLLQTLEEEPRMPRLSSAFRPHP
jgi:hypothetical protein